MKSLDELRSIKDRVKEDMRVRQNQDEIRIVIGMGTCGIAAGARDALETIMEELNKRRLNAVVSQTGCVGICSREPLIDVYMPGEPRVTYGEVTPNRARQIVAQHIANGNVIMEWALNVKETE